MSSPHKAKGDVILGMTASEAKVLLLGILSFEDQPKVNYAKLAEKGGYTLSSASVLYRKSLKKLHDNNKDDGEVISAKSTPVKKAASKRKVSTPVKGKATAAETDSTAIQPNTIDPALGAETGAEADSEAPKKRQRRAYTKKGTAVKVGKKAKALKRKDAGVAADAAGADSGVDAGADAGTDAACDSGVAAGADTDEDVPATPTPKSKAKSGAKATVHKDSDTVSEESDAVRDACDAITEASDAIREAAGTFMGASNSPQEEEEESAPPIDDEAAAQAHRDMIMLFHSTDASLARDSSIERAIENLNDFQDF